MMIRTSDDKNTANVKFISYTGKYPCLCNGVLTLEIDGEVVKFGNDDYSVDYDNKTGQYSNGNYEKFWHSGGGIQKYHAYQEEWEIYENKLPDKYKKYIVDIDYVFNANVEYGCCGGCI